MNGRFAHGRVQQISVRLNDQQEKKWFISFCRPRPANSSCAYCTNTYPHFFVAPALRIVIAVIAIRFSDEVLIIIARHITNAEEY